MSGAEWDAYMSEITALLDVQNVKIESLRDTVGFIATQQASTAQTQEAVYFLIVGLIAAIIAFLGMLYGAKIVKALMEVMTKWL